MRENSALGQVALNHDHTDHTDEVPVDQEFIGAYVDYVTARNEIARLSAAVGTVAIPVSLKELSIRVQARAKIMRGWADAHGVAEGWRYSPARKAFVKAPPQSVPGASAADTLHLGDGAGVTIACAACGAVVQPGRDHVCKDPVSTKVRPN